MMQERTLDKAQEPRLGMLKGRAGRWIIGSFFVLLVLAGGWRFILRPMLTGSSAPTITPTTAKLALTPAASSTPTPTPAPTPMPTSTPAPSPSPTPPAPLARVEVMGPATYPGDLPYLGAIRVLSTEAQGDVLVEANCEGVLWPQGVAVGQVLSPGQAAAFFFLIPPGHEPVCRVVVAGQECGEWTVAPYQDALLAQGAEPEDGGSPSSDTETARYEEIVTMTCVALGSGEGEP